ncbi:MAG TPA: hypothetical protein VIW78_06740, partial [Burkholderiales bacterium]
RIVSNLIRAQAPQAILCAIMLARSNVKRIRAIFAASLLLFASFALADRLDEIKSRGELIVG